MARQRQRLSEPSFFRKGGLIVPGGPGEVHCVAGKNLDGSYYMKVGDVQCILAPKQIFDLCVGLLKSLGYEVNLPRPAGPEGTWKPGHDGVRQ